MLTGVRNHPIREHVKPKTATNSEMMAVALLAIGALALVLGVLGHFQIGKLANMGWSWNLGLMIGGGVLVVLQVGYLLIQMRKEGGSPALKASGKAPLKSGTVPSLSVTSQTSTCVPIWCSKCNDKLFDVKPNQTIRSIKERIMERKPLSKSDDYAIYYKGVELQETYGGFETVLGDYIGQDVSGLTWSKKTRMPPLKAPITPLNITFRMLNASSITLTIDANDTIGQVKERLCVERGTPLARQRLLYEGYDLDDEKPVRSYNIQEGSTLALFIKPGILLT